MSVHRCIRLGMGLAGLLYLAAASGCTSYRIVRHRDPDARNQRMFPTRPVEPAQRAFEFARASVQRIDLDTITVRAAGGRRIPFKEYLSDHAVLAFLVIRNDTVLYETYRDGMTDSTIHSSFSVAKSVLSALVGIAVGEGRIRSLDDAVADYVTELRGRPAFAGMTVRHLLEMKSGLRYTTTGRGMFADFRSDEARAFYAADLREFLLGTPRAHEPGVLWAYKDTDAELLGWVLSRAVGMSVAAYTEARLWKRIGAEHAATWSLDHRGGMEKVSNGFNATAPDLARFGRLFLHGGMWDGTLVVPADWVARSVAVDSSRTEPEVSTWWKMQHTLYWWHPIQPPQGDFYAEGSRGQRIYVDPATNTVIVQLANQTRQDFPFRRVVAYLNGRAWEYPRSIPALLRETATAFGADSVRPVFDRLWSEQLAEPERYVITVAAMTTVGLALVDDPRTRAAGLEVLRLTTERFPAAPLAFLRLGDAYVRVGEPEMARAALERAATLAPRDPEVRARLRALRRRRGDQPERGRSDPERSG